MKLKCENHYIILSPEIFSVVLSDLFSSNTNIESVEDKIMGVPIVRTKDVNIINNKDKNDKQIWFLGWFKSQINRM